MSIILICSTIIFNCLFTYFGYLPNVLSLGMQILPQSLSKLTRYTALCALFIAGTGDLKAQNIIQKLSKKFLSAEKDSTRSGSFMVLPAVGYAQETGVEYGLASSYNFYMDKSDPYIRTSTMTLMGTFTSKHQSNFKFQTDLWTKNNDYHFVSEIRYRNWPFNYYGIGMDTWKADEERVDQKLFRVKLEAEKKIGNNLYSGINIQYDNFSIRSDSSDHIFNQSNLIGKEGGQQLLLGVSQLFDNRDNVSYSTRGYYAKLRLSYAPKLWTREDFNGTNLDLDLRGFIPLHQKVTLALQGIFRSTFGKTIPFYNYRELGGDMMMRGYYLGRYRDKNYLASQAELRYRFHPRFGIVGFSGIGSTFSKENSSRYVPSYGGGLRYFFSLEHNSSIRFDYSYGEQRAGEKRQSGFYLSLSEAF